MHLLQISEPGERKRAATSGQKAVGIDLGTTHSLVATVQQGRPVALAPQDGRTLVPSVVYFSAQGEVVVGDPAMQAGVEHPLSVVASVKRLMGRSLSDVQQQGRWQQEMRAVEGSVALATPQGWKTPVEISSLILASLRSRAVSLLGEDIAGAVITVPAYFDDAQRQATRDAARLAGLNVLRLLSEPTAAAVAYGLDHGAEGLHVVFDLGGGTLDVSVLRLHQGVFQVLATAGDTQLGGDDLDHVIMDWIRTQSGWDGQEPHAVFELRQMARTIKHQLSVAPEVEVSWQGWKALLARDSFEQLVQPWIERSLRCLRRAVRDAGVELSSIQEVVLVGGSTRIPRIRAALKELFGKPPLTHLDPDEVVALGAAIQADALVGNKPDVEMLLLDVLPLSLGLETMGGLVERLLPRNSPIPATVSQEFTTFKDGQTAMSLHVVQGERERVDDCRSLARFELRGLPPRVAGALKIRVTFQVDADGLLSVSAIEPDSGVRQDVQVKPSHGLSEQTITEMLKQAIDLAEQDKHERSIREVRLDAERLIQALDSALALDATLLASTELAQLQHDRQHLLSILHESEPDRIRRAMEVLEAHTQDFAARRMNQEIRKALAGRSVDSLDVS